MFWVILVCHRSRVWGLSWGDLLAPRNFQGMEGGWAVLLPQETPRESRDRSSSALGRIFPIFPKAPDGWEGLWMLSLHTHHLQRSGVQVSN